MKKIKKIFAIVLAMAMVLGMSVTAFAATTDTATITIKGLAADDSTTLNMYQFISLDENGNEWKVAEWADEFVSEDEENGSYTISDPEKLAEATSGEPTMTMTTQDTEYTFDNVSIGAYLIIASGVKATYTPMVADVADYGNNGLITAKNVTITAKTSGYTVDKSAEDNFVARGETVTFTITTTFPSFDDPSANGNSYTIEDTPTGLDALTISSVKIGGEEVEDPSFDEENGKYTLDLTGQIGDQNANAGKTVVVTYTAVVTAESGYSNTANAYRNDTELGKGDTAGYTGSITVKKVDSSDNTKVLTGAEFEVKKDDATLYFVKISDGVYKLAGSDEEEASQTVVATNGIVKVEGLDEGTYIFNETKAPQGYSVAENGVTVTISENEAEGANVDLAGTEDLNYTNTKLSSLPSTGGIGTTIFTIGGCAIIVVAAGLFFASRRKKSA